MASRFERLNNVAPVADPLNQKKTSVGRSNLPMSYLLGLNASIGGVHILDWIRTLPNSDYDLSYDIQVKLRNPSVRRLLSGMSWFVHATYCRDSDLWEGARNYISKGKTGTYNIQKPVFKWNPNKGSSPSYTTLTPSSPADELGIHARMCDISNPLLMYRPCSTSTSSTVKAVRPMFYDGFKINALPLVHYQKMCKSMFFPKNLLIHNDYYYPENIEHDLLPYNADEVDILNYEKANAYDLMKQFNISDSDYNTEINAFFSALTSATGDEEYFVPVDHTPVDGSSSSKRAEILKAQCWLNARRYRQFRGDPYVSGLPFPDLIRGTVPEMDLITETSRYIDASEAIEESSVGNGNVSLNLNDSKFSYGTGTVTTAQLDSLKSAFHKLKVDNLKYKFSANNLRTLIALTIMGERNGRTDGSYNELIEAQFGYNPHTPDLEPKYIGGLKGDLLMSDVTQTSETSASSPLGSQAGQMSSVNSGRLGHFHSPDYGSILVTIEFVPDIYYTDGINRQLTTVKNEEEYYPILENLPPQGQKNSEIMITGNQNYDDDVFNWQERFIEYKDKRNRVSGLLSLGHNISEIDACSIMARRFDSNNPPAFNNEFVTMSPKNIDMNIFSVTNEPPFIVEANSRIDQVLPMSYFTRPTEFGM